MENLLFLANRPLYTKTFALTSGDECRSATVKDVASELHLDGHTVKEPEKQYLGEQLQRAVQAPRSSGGLTSALAGQGMTVRVLSVLWRAPAVQGNCVADEVPMHRG